MDCGKIVINAGKKLLESGQLSVFVKYAFTDFNKEYRATFIKTIGEKYEKSTDDPLQNVIEKQRTSLVKCILCSLVRYMGQI